jgi:hypothetical protein
MLILGSLAGLLSAAPEASLVGAAAGGFEAPAERVAPPAEPGVPVDPEDFCDVDGCPCVAFCGAFCGGAPPFSLLISDLGTARFASTYDQKMSKSFYFSILAELATFLESIVCGSLASALSTAETSAKVTNPNPRERFVTGSFITTASCTVPYCLKCFLSFSAITNMEISNRYTSVTRREQLQLTLVSRKIQSTDKDFSA